jgi:hypothetical protein
MKELGSASVVSGFLHDGMFHALGVTLEVPDLLGPLHRSGSKCEAQVLATFFSWAHRFGNAAIFGPYSIHRITFTIPIKYLLFSENADFFSK